MGQIWLHAHSAVYRHCAVGLRRTQPPVNAQESWGKTTIVKNKVYFVKERGISVHETELFTRCLQLFIRAYFPAWFWFTNYQLPHVPAREFVRVVNMHMNY